MTNNNSDNIKYHIPKNNLKTFSKLVGINPSLIIDAPLLKIDKKINNSPSNSNCNCFLSFFLFFRFFFATNITSFTLVYNEQNPCQLLIDNEREGKFKFF